MIRIHVSRLQGLHRAWADFIDWSLRNQTGEPDNPADIVRGLLGEDSPLGDVSDAVNTVLDAWAKRPEQGGDPGAPF